MKRYWIFSTLCIVVLMTGILVLASDRNFFNSGELTEKKDNTSIESQDEMYGNDSSVASQSETSVDNIDFACNLFRSINKQIGGGKSIIVSPISVGYLLGMLHEGADGETRRQINKILGLGGSVQEINEYFKKMMDEVANVDSTVTVKTANSIFVVSGGSLQPKFRDDMQNFYNALADGVSYNESSILNNINNWCKKNTDGMIPELLKEGELNPNRVMYLLNAVYFKASWTDKFDPEETRDRDFSKHDGTTIKLPMMHLKTKAAYANYDQFKMLRLPYGNKSYSMYVLLPNEGKTIDDVIRNISAQKMKEWQSQMWTDDVDILMPRFTTESETHLKGILSSMGMSRAFGVDAEFPNMLEGYHDDLYVSMMKQKAKIEVSEEGTRAAAVTIAEMSLKCATPSRPEYVEFHATRPFVYYIVDNSTGTIYFMGTYCGEGGVLVNVQGHKNNNSADEIFKAVEQMPQFPGGEAALMEYIESHIQWPPMEGCVQGRVVVQFVVDSLGYVGEVKVVRSVDKELDNEAVRLIKTLPKFIPGRHKGRAVSVWYTLPVTFKLKGVGE